MAPKLLTAVKEPSAWHSEASRRNMQRQQEESRLKTLRISLTNSEGIQSEGGSKKVWSIRKDREASGSIISVLGLRIEGNGVPWKNNARNEKKACCKR